LESLASEGGQNESRFVDLLAVVPAKLLLLFGRPGAKWLLEIAVGVLAANHEANLAGGVGRDCGVTVFDVGEDLLAGLLEVDNEGHVKPLVLGYKRMLAIDKSSTFPARRCRGKMNVTEGIRRGLTTLGGNYTAFTERAVKQLEVRLLEESLSGTFWVAGVGDDDVEFALLVLEELEAVTDNGGGLWVLEADRHAGEVLLGETDDSLVDVAEGGLLDTVVLDNLTEHTTVTTANDQNLLRVGVGVHGKVGDHLLVAVLSSTIVRAFQSRCNIRELVAFSALDDVVENEDSAVVGGLEDEDVLVLALLMVKNLLDLERHGLTGPHAGDLAEPAIYNELLAIDL
jgi:hypothetical protein